MQTPVQSGAGSEFGIRCCASSTGPWCCVAIAFITEDDWLYLHSYAGYTIVGLRGVRIDEGVEGHGLGLSICQMVVESYAGTLELGNVQGGGVEARVTLPAGP